MNINKNKIDPDYERKLNDFYNNSSEFIMSETLLVFITDWLESKTNYRYITMPWSDHDAFIEGGYMLAFLKDKNVELDEVDIKKIQDGKFYTIFIDSQFDYVTIPLSFSCISLINKNLPLKILY